MLHFEFLSALNKHRGQHREELYVLAGQTVPRWVVSGQAGKTKGLKSFRGFDMWRYSQQGLIDSGLRGGKASRRGRKQPKRVASRASLWLLSLCLFYAIRAEMMQGRVKTKEMSQLVLNTTTGLPLSSTFCIILLSNLSLHFTSTCRVSRHNAVPPPLSLSMCSLLWTSVCSDRRMNAG